MSDDSQASGVGSIPATLPLIFGSQRTCPVWASELGSLFAMLMKVRGSLEWSRIWEKEVEHAGKSSVLNSLKETAFEDSRCREAFLLERSVLLWPRMSSAAHT